MWYLLGNWWSGITFWKLIQLGSIAFLVEVFIVFSLADLFWLSNFKMLLYKYYLIGVMRGINCNFFQTVTWYMYVDLIFLLSGIFFSANGWTDPVCPRRPLPRHKNSRSNKNHWAEPRDPPQRSILWSCMVRPWRCGHLGHQPQRSRLAVWCEGH